MSSVKDLLIASGARLEEGNSHAVHPAAGADAVATPKSTRMEAVQKKLNVNAISKLTNFLMIHLPKILTQFIFWIIKTYTLSFSS